MVRDGIHRGRKTMGVAREIVGNKTKAGMREEVAEDEDKGRTGGGSATEHTEATERRKGREGRRKAGGKICTRKDTEDTDGKGEERMGW